MVRNATQAAPAPMAAIRFNFGLIGSGGGAPQELESPHEMELRVRPGGIMVVFVAELRKGGGTEGFSACACSSAGGGTGDSYASAC